jgi:hypothetical protein
MHKRHIKKEVAWSCFMHKRHIKKEVAWSCFQLICILNTRYTGSHKQ